MYNDVRLNKHGFYSLKELPSDEEREAYYKEKYYQNGMGSYEISYSDKELCFFNAKLEQKLLVISEHIHLSSPSQSLSFLDIGCGEGFALNFLKEKGFDVLGLDYSDAGIMMQNPSVISNVMLGDLYISIHELAKNAKKFDIVNMDNLLEHVVDPEYLLQQTYKLLADNGIALIKVPNDFSELQKYFYKHDIIKKANWVAPLDHISYFNKEGLLNICNAVGLNCIDFLSDQLIEFFAFNPNTNYFANKDVGKSCHIARVAQENFLHEISPKKTIEMYRVLGQMGLGREIIGVFQKAHSNG